MIVRDHGDKVLCELDVEARDQVRSLKQRLSSVLSIEAHRIRLQYEEHELEYDGRTAAQYGIQDGGALRMSECARPKRVLLAASGSVAAVKVPPIATQLRSLGFAVAARLVSSHLVPSRLVSSPLVSSHLVSPRLVSSRLVSVLSSRPISSLLFPCSSPPAS